MIEQARLYLYNAIARVTGAAVSLFARLITALRPVWLGCEPIADKRVYFANHTSNGDFVVVWTALPPSLRSQTRPVAAADYWLASRLRSFAGRWVFNAVLIDRRPDMRTENPVDQIVAALDDGYSLILFPEGKRNTTAEAVLPFKTGLYHVAAARPDVDLVPVWIANLSRIMPKGEIIPLPLLCTVTFGAPLRLNEGEAKADFLLRAANELRALAPVAT
ncbi:lysophospholipid acyltransferase family protein [Neotabrizicola shimadae]|uniref:lysophospholipid acyltransferase family protein n=1 Tax=Neotabrizicola shimadae TaxID=2807096 RepID=UPI002176CB1C|nr:lysophospholipid acyltransferase family protein [Neotabrizicola shimadae]